MEKRIFLASLSQLFSKELKDQKLIAVSDKDSQQEVLETLDKNGILSAPVRNNEDSFIAIVNKIDILTPLLFAPKEKKVVTSEKDVHWPKLDDAVSEVLKVSPETSTGSSGLVSFVFEESDVLPQLLKAFSSGFHRVLVRGPKNVRVVSQSDVIAYFDKNINRLPSFKDEPVTSFLKKSVKSIPSEATAYAAFRELLIQGVQAAPIIDSSEKLIGTISLSDTRGLNKDTLKDLFLPVLDYLKKQSKQTKLITLDQKDTFATTVNKLASNHLHRAWVVENEKVIGVASLTDVCLFVFASPVVEKHYGNYLARLQKQFNLLKVPLVTLVGDKKDAIFVSSTTSQKDVLELLAKNKFLAAPVKDKDTDQVIGITTLVDIFSLLWLEKSLQEKGDKVTKDELLAAFEKGGKQTIDTTIFSRENVNFLIFDERETLAKVMESFSQGYHRLLVSSAYNSSSYKILTQSDVIAWLNTVVSKLGTSANLKANQIVKCDGKVVTCVQSTQSALSAFRALTSRSLIAGPVINSSGVVIGNFSISDLRGLTSEDIPDLLVSIEDFFKKTTWRQNSRTNNSEAN